MDDNMSDQVAPEMQAFLPSPFHLAVPLPPWAPDDGPVPGVYESKPVGHRCTWAWRWGGPSGVISADDIRPLGELTRQERYYEMRDIAERSGPYQMAAAACVEAWDTPEGNRLLARFDLAGARNCYPESNADWLPINKRLALVWRPGWRPEGAPGVFAR